MESRYMTDLEWRICHAVNIYLYRNGQDGEAPQLVHIPPSKKKNMKTVMNAIQERVNYPVGYATYLYKMDGKRVRHPCELEMYNNYVVASNYDKHFKCAQYGRKRSPLLVLNKDSKHIRVLRQHNENYQEWMMKKKALGEERPQFIFPTFYTNEDPRPQDLPVKQIGNYGPMGNCPFPQEEMDRGKGSHHNKGHDHEGSHHDHNHNKGHDRHDREYTVNTMETDAIANVTGTLKALRSTIFDTNEPDISIYNKKQNRKSELRHPSDFLNANLTDRCSSSDMKSEESETGIQTDCMGSKYQRELREFKKYIKKRAVKELEAKISESSIELSHEKATRRRSIFKKSPVVLPPPPLKFRDNPW